MSLPNNKNMKCCPFCGSNQITHYVSYLNIQWKKCPDCKMGWQDPYVSELNQESYEAFDQIYQNYFQFRDVFEAIAKEKAQWIYRNLPDHCAIIELGAGLGCLGTEIRRLGPNIPYVAIEPNSRFAENLRSSGIQVESDSPMQATIRVIQEFQKLNRPVVVIMDNLLEHVENPKSLLRDIHSHALQGSKVFIEVPNEAGLNWRFHLQNMLRGSVKAPTFPGHINLFVHQSLGRLLRDSGLTEIQIEGAGIRNETQIHYLSQSRILSPQLRLAIRFLRILPLDQLLGLSYWLRAEANIGSVASPERI